MSYDLLELLFQISFVFLHHWIFIPILNMQLTAKPWRMPLLPWTKLLLKSMSLIVSFTLVVVCVRYYICTVQANTPSLSWGFTDWFIWTWLLPDTWVPLYRSDDVEYCAKLHWYKVYKSFWNSYCGKMVVFRLFATFLLAFSTMINIYVSLSILDILQRIETVWTFLCNTGLGNWFCYHHLHWFG